MKQSLTDTTTKNHLEHRLCSELKGVGSVLAQRLAKCGIRTLQDLLFHLPYRYQDRTRLTAIRDLRLGDYAVAEGRITHSAVKFGRRPRLECTLQDATGQLQILFFNFHPGLQQHLVDGAWLRCFGEVRGLGRQLSMIHPEFQHVQTGDEVPVEQTLTPIYHTTAGLSQQRLRDLTDQALTLLEQGGLLAELLPEIILQHYQLTELATAVALLHRPPPQISFAQLEAGEHPAQQRLVFEELLAHQLSKLQLRQQVNQQVADPLPATQEYSDSFIKQLPFTLTQAQQRVIAEISEDLAQPHPMQRLLQGDVGSGKTVVAAMAALQAIEAGYQVALMAPTEILAEQHLAKFSEWFMTLDIKVVWLMGSLSSGLRKAMLATLTSGEAQLVIGTHALVQADVQFYKLGLVIVDEQHRFGVEQRLLLLEKGYQQQQIPHQLIMTATPIPRTLAMTAYADLNVSVIDELPPGRTPIQTAVVPNTRRSQIVERIIETCRKQRQVYWVCPLIEESEVLQCQAAEDTAAHLQQVLVDFNVGLIHGRMKGIDKETIMSDFKSGRIDVLVATTVIEVGVDVPNASLMIIENCERLGLSQLHQLRGRVGRGCVESYCILLYQAPLSEAGKQRLQVMRDTTDGFVIAQQDLMIRGPGEILGTKQTGLANMRVANLVRDQYLLTQVNEVAQQVMQQYPQVITPLIQRWLGDGEKYGRI
ncbi:MAG: ATP-dependent DNA helicase RecG [Legionellales bacterium]|nr:ATP-dependent DNA helicase RecG [Legionellales bacterium]